MRLLAAGVPVSPTILSISGLTFFSALNLFDWFDLKLLSSSITTMSNGHLRFSVARYSTNQTTFSRLIT